MTSYWSFILLVLIHFLFIYSFSGPSFSSYPFTAGNYRAAAPWSVKKKKRRGQPLQGKAHDPLAEHWARRPIPHSHLSFPEIPPLFLFHFAPDIIFYSSIKRHTFQQIKKKKKCFRATQSFFYIPEYNSTPSLIARQSVGKPACAFN